MADYDYVRVVSIVLLAYNSYSNLSRCIESVAKQDYDNIEIVFADDGSRNIDPDEIRRTADRILNNRFNIKYLFAEKNRGTVKNFNNAISESCGDLIVPLTVDDSFVDDSVISRIVNHFNENKSLIAKSYLCVVNGTEVCVYPNDEDLKLLDDPSAADIMLLKRGLFFKGANTYYHKDVFKKMGSFDENYVLYEDVPFLHKCLSEGIRVTVVPHVCLMYSTGGMSTKKKYPEQLRLDRIRLYRDVLSQQRFKSISRWMKYRIYRHEYPSNKIVPLLLYPDVIVRDKIYRRTHRYKRTMLNSRSEIAGYIKTINDNI